MPPKEDNSAAPAAAAVVEDTGEAPTTNATAAASDGRRRDREEPAEEQRVLRARQEVAEVRKWEWSSPVSDILLHRINPVVENMGLRDFVTKYVRRDYPIEQIDDYAMDVVVEELEECVTDGDLRRRIEGREAFQQLRNTRQARIQAMKDADILEQRGIVSLGQWKSTVNRDALSISAYAKGILDNAISTAEQTDNLLRQQEETRQLKEELEKMKLSPQANVTVLDGVYDSICNASWNYLVKSPNSVPAKLWLEVKGDNSPLQEWSDTEVEYFTQALSDADATRYREERENECKEDKDNVKPTRERLQMKVLTSTQGWPYNSDSDEIKIFDCYITKEVERAWRFIKDDLFEWFDDPSRTGKKPRKRILIGTPGIGKSMAVGSYLLYQMLRYNGERLPVVAYFIGGKLYIFDKTAKQVTMYDAVKDFTIVEKIAQNCKGYTIFDCSMEISLPKTTLPESWGTVLISSPNENNFKYYYTQRTPTKIVVNCPTTADLKAMHIWKQHGNNNTEDILSGWAVIKERAKDLGPLPRFVFNGSTSKDRKKVVNDEIDIIDNTNVSQYVGVSTEMWATKRPCHKLAMIFRESTDIPDRMDFYRNAPLSGRIKCNLVKQLTKLLESNEFLKTALFNANHAAWVALETYACGAFRNKDFVSAAGKEIQCLKREARNKERRCILQKDLEATPTEETKTAYSVGTFRSPETEKTIEFKKLYIPESETFPLVDAFFFARSSEGKTILVGLQTTIASRHPTKTSTVCQFMDYLSNFDGWADHWTDLVMEIIYVQSQGVKQIDKWQKCLKVEGSIYSAQQQEEADKFWNDRVFQYHLCLSSNLKENLL